MKNIIYYLFIELIGLVLKVISLFIYFFVWPFRYKVLKWAKKHFKEDEYKMFVMINGHKKWKVYFYLRFWFFCFTTGLTDRWHGPDDFMREQKERWFKHVRIFTDYNLFTETMPTHLETWYDMFSFKQKIQYFWICYRFQAIRNAHWAFNEWFFREGEYKEGSMIIKYSIAPYPIDQILMPELEWDESTTDKQLRYFYEATGENDKWKTTREGKKLMTFITRKGNKRFYRGYCKIISLYKIKRLLAIERLFGWNSWNGIPEFHNKYIFLKMNETSLAKYNKYIDLLKEIKN